ncbi:MAG TPA: hypothetical protein VGE76_09810, partial [Opitutaceae bacterium]
MNDPASPSAANSAARSAPADFCAVLVLDAQGRIAGATTSAQTLWQAAEGELIGEHLASLFVFEIVS